MTSILVELRKRLYDLSSRNKSLAHLRLSTKLDADLKLFEFANGKNLMELVHFLFSNQSSYFLCPVQDARSEGVNALSLQLLKVARAVEQIEEESGVYELFVGWPYIEGKFQEGTSFRAPLLVYPVRLEKVEKKWLLTRSQKKVQFNHAFLLALKHYQNLLVPNEWLEDDFFDLDTFDPLVFKTDLIQKLSDLNLDVRFDRSFFEDSFIYFKSYLKDELVLKYNNGAVFLSNEILLGVYPQSSSYLGPDYDTWIEQCPQFSIEDFFASKMSMSTDNYREKIPLPFTLDASQEEVIMQVWNGKSLVIQGPPGSGKSETICNLVSSYIASGKKVLVISQKRVALEVIYERLKSIGCADFLAFVQDVQLDQSRLYLQLKQHIEQLELYKSETSTMDVIADERLYNQSIHILEKYVSETTLFRNALLAIQPEGYVVKDLYLQVDITYSTLEVSSWYLYYSKNALETLLHFLSAYKKYNVVFETISHTLWLDRKLSPIAYEQLMFNKTSIIDQYSVLIEQMKQLQMLLPLPFHPIFIQHTSLVGDLQSLLKVDFRNQQHTKSIHELLNLQEQWLKVERLYEKHQLLFNHYTLQELKEIYQMYKMEHIHDKNFIQWLFYKWFNKKSKNLQAFLKLYFGNKNLHSALESKEVLNEVNEVIDFIQDVFVASSQEKIKSIEKYHLQYHQLLQTYNHKQTLFEEVFLNELISLKKDRFDECVTQIISTYGTYEKCKEVCLQYISPAHWHTFLNRGDGLKEWLDFVITHSVDISAVNQLCLEQNETDLDFIQYLHHQNVNFEAIEKYVFHSICLSWLSAYERKFPILKTVGSISWESRFEDWSKAWETKQKLSINKVLHYLKESTFHSLEYNRLNNRTTYRALLHQVSKKRKVWGLRKLFDAFSDEVLKLMPCWLMSPEMVSLTFLQKEYFDLVIFDEASQCFVEKGLSAMLRAKQCVVSGDSKQLQPNDLYQIRYENEEEEHVDLEQDSLLNLALHYLPSIQLKGHYRSEYPSLIHFSNKHFYNHQLQFVPHQQAMQEESYFPLEYNQVAGVWENNINPIEAAAVVDKVLQLVRSNIHSIGVITFNSKQAQCIKDLMFERFEAEQILLPKSIFVKNIENVQGDERDYILFSVAYAADVKGKLRMQFGSLNVKGGENRLNVAITRAKKKVIVFASFEPNQLKAEQLTNSGGQFLKAYLIFVYENSQRNSLKFFEYNNKHISVHGTSHKLLQLDTSRKYEKKYDFVDLSYVNNDEECLLDTDDDLFQQAQSAKAWFLYKPMLMKRKGWKYEQIYSPVLFQK